MAKIGKKECGNVLGCCSGGEGQSNLTSRGQGRRPILQTGTKGHKNVLCHGIMSLETPKLAEP